MHKKIVCGLVCVMLFALLALPQTVQAQQLQQSILPQGTEPEAYIVIDAKTGQVLIEKNAGEMRFPASVTKILTLALALEEKGYDTALSEPVELSRVAVSMPTYMAANVALMPEELASFQDLLQATYIRSANDAANGLAEYVSGSIEVFAERMNSKATALGLTGSHFMNPSGLPDTGHYTTAYDMAQITRWALTVPGMREVFSSTGYTMAPTNLQPSERVWSTNNMMLQPNSGKYYEGVTGSKTGHTDDAMYTMVTSAKRGDTELICVVLKCAYNDLKYTATTALFDYCFDNFSRVIYPASQLQKVNVPIYGGGEKPLGELTVLAGAGESFLLHNSLSIDDVSFEMQVPEKYIIGQPFAPTVRFILAQGNEFQSGEVVSEPLSWTGLDEVLAARTAGTWDTAIAKFPMMPWIVFGAILTIAFVIISRTVLVRRKRQKRRRARISAARSQVPIRAAPRPLPPETRGRYVRTPSGAQRPAVSRAFSEPKKQVYTNQPHRTGRMH